MKSVLVTAILGEPYLTDHYGNFRGEGRIPINIGFGLMELGFQVNIVYEYFKELAFVKNNGNKGSVLLSRSPNNKEYDFQLFWDRIQPVTSKKEICIINYTHEIKRFENVKGLTYVTPYIDLVDFMSKESKQPVKYLPQINPITLYHKGFKDFNYDITNKEIVNVFVYISSWERNTLCIREFGIILERIKYLLNRDNHKVKLFIQVNDEQMKKDCRTILRYGDEIEFIGKFNYINYLKMIETMDIFILKGTQFMASAGMYDIISLGKPMLYVSESIHPGVYRNPLFHNPEYLIIEGDNERNINRKVDNFIGDPKILYDMFKDNLKDSDFENWKKHALEIFKL